MNTTKIKEAVQGIVQLRVDGLLLTLSIYQNANDSTDTDIRMEPTHVQLFDV